MHAQRLRGSATSKLKWNSVCGGYCIRSRPLMQSVGISELGPLLLWGGFCQGGAPRVLSIFSSFSFFVRPGSRFFAPTHTASGRRAQERSRLARPLGGHRQGLDGFEHDGILVVVGMTTSRGARMWWTNIRAHILLFGGPKTQTMMQ